METLITSYVLATDNIHLPNNLNQLMQNSVDGLLKTYNTDINNLPLSILGLKYHNNITPTEQIIKKDKRVKANLTELSDLYRQYIKHTNNGQVSDTATKIANAILVYYRQNGEAIYKEGLPNAIPIFEIFDIHSRRLQTETQLRNLTTPFLLPIKTVKGLTDIVVTEGKILSPPNKLQDISESDIHKALIAILSNKGQQPKGSNSIYCNTFIDMLDSGDVNSVIHPTSIFTKSLISCFMYSKLEGAPSPRVLFEQVGYTLPNLLANFDMPTMQSFYATSDNENIVVVQFDSNFRVKGTVTLPNKDFERFYTYETQIEFKNYTDVNTNQQYENIPMVNGVPLETLLGTKIKFHC